jgi:hypothetical protein
MLGYHRKEGELTGAEGGRGALAQSSSKKGRGSGRGWCAEAWSSDGSFYRRPGQEAAKDQLAQARDATAAMGVHSAGDETSRAGCEHSDLRGGAVPNFTGAGVMTRRRGEGGDRRGLRR